MYFCKKTMKEIYIISSWPNNEYKENILVDLIDKVKSLDKEVLLVSHYLIPDWIVNKVDYYIYDSVNLLDNSRTLDKYPNDSYFDMRNNGGFYIEKINPLHSITLLRIFHIAFNFVKTLGYDYFVFVEYDTMFSLNDLKKYDTIKNKLIESNKKLFFFKLRPYEFPFWEDNGIYKVYETHSWGGFVDEFLSKVKLHYELDTWHTELKKDYKNRLLEYYFTNIFSTKESEYLILDSFRNEFTDSKVNLSNSTSYTDVYVNPDNLLNPILFIFNDSNIQKTYKIFASSIKIGDFDITLNPNCWWFTGVDVTKYNCDILIRQYDGKNLIDTNSYLIDREYIDKNLNRKKITFVK